MDENDNAFKLHFTEVDEQFIKFPSDNCCHLNRGRKLFFVGSSRDVQIYPMVGEFRSTLP